MIAAAATIIDRTSAWGRAAPWIALVVLVAWVVGLVVSVRHKAWVVVGALTVVLVLAVAMVVPVHSSVDHSQPPVPAQHP